MDDFGTYLMHRHRAHASARRWRWISMAGRGLLNFLAAVLLIALLLAMFYLAPIFDALMVGPVS